MPRGLMASWSSPYLTYELHRETYLSLAQDLLVHVQHVSTEPSTPDLDEARLRTSISRAYYAAFWCCRAYWRRTQPEHPLPTDGQVHFEVRSRFERYGDPNLQSIAEHLKRLRDARRQADYEELVTNLPQVALSAVRWANRVLNDVGSLGD